MTNSGDVILSREILFEVFELALGDYADSRQPAQLTPDSLARIEQALGVPIPLTLQAMATRCPSYGAWFANLGPDLTHPHHIIALNERFHREGLSSQLIGINRGFAADLDCIERPVGDKASVSVVYCQLVRGATTRMRTWPSFESYLEDLCRKHAARIMNPAPRARAMELLARLPA